MIAYMATLVYAQQGPVQGGEQTAQTGAQPSTNNSEQYYQDLQMDYSYYMLIAMAGTVVLIFAWKMILKLTSHLRRLYGLAKENQSYFARDDYRMAWLKRHLVYAPLFRTRHNREFQLSQAIHMGTLPNRFQALCLAGLVAMNVSLCVLHIPFNEGLQSFSGLLRNRAGTLAVTNLIPLVILAGRNNPLIPLLGLSFDTWNFFHRWLARIVTLEGITHMLSWMIADVEQSGWASVAKAFQESRQQMTGLVVCKIFCLPFSC